MNDEQQPANAMSLLSQLCMIPLAAFVYGMEVLLKTLQGMQQITNQGMEVMVGSNGFSSRAAADMQAGTSMISNMGPGENGISNEEENTLNENINFCNPHQDGGRCLILWRYKVLFIKRDLEHAFPEVEDLVPDDVPDITAWKIAEFIQQLGGRQVAVPKSWINKRKGPLKYWRIERSDKPPKSYEEAYDAAERGEKVWLIGLDEDDKRYLRLYSQELARYTREKPRYEEDQIKVLEQIRDNLAHKSTGKTP